MRPPLALLVAVLAACVTAAAGASPSYPVVSHSIKVEFSISIDVEWTSDTGTRRTEPCGTWAHEEGSYEVTASSIGKLPPGRKAGSFIHPLNQDIFRARHWAILYAAGQARVHMTRTLRQKGQTNACGDYPAEPTKFPPNDCGERRYVSRHAFIRPDWRDSVSTLEEIVSAPEHLRTTSLLAISIDAPAQQFVYRRCDVPAASFPTGVQNVGVPVAGESCESCRGALRKLRSLRIGQTVGIEFAPAGKANCMRSLPPGETCKFSVVIQVDITRVKPPSGR